MYPPSTILLFLLSPYIILAEKPSCKTLMVDRMKCRIERRPINKRSCDAVCETVSVDDCNTVEPEECITEHERRCDGEAAASLPLPPPIAVPDPIPSTGLADGRLTLLQLGKVKAVLAGAGISTTTVPATIKSVVDESRKKRSIGFGLGQLVLAPAVGLAKLHKLKKLLKKAGIVVAAVSGVAAKKKGGEEEEEICFEIPRTVCPVTYNSSPITSSDHHSTQGCVTTVQTVCGSNSYRRKRSLPEGCSLEPKAQHCVKKEAKQLCKKVDKEVCAPLPKECYEEIEICGQEKVKEEVCDSAL